MSFVTAPVKRMLPQFGLAGVRLRTYLLYGFVLIATLPLLSLSLIHNRLFSAHRAKEAAN